ncbi:hypothetical protein CVT26_001807 [Gymnopilus dilepis]|uniref:F-box domain-containing protein n=1 Tax=Gymnopilus dilepis TaxID=231916 RepID=A0A409Y432_9AGAR|nr:hypothetical protein CVT26_001807 [Gymnopilus dilepis]
MPSTVSYASFNLKAPKTCPMTSKGSPCAPCTKTRQLEARIEKARKALDGLVEEHRALRTQMNNLHDPLSNLLPPEISSSIFRACLPTMPHPYVCTDHDNADGDAFTTPWTIAAVSQKWRRMAWSSPDLWSNIIVNADRPLSNQVDKVQHCLNSAGQLPLTIRVYAEKIQLDEYSHLYTIIRLLNEQCSRWHTLDLRMPFSFLTDFCNTSQPISNLQVLRLRCPSSSPLPADIFSFRNSKPKPLEVNLQFVPFGSVDIDWSRPTRTTFRRIQVSECLALFKQAPALKECTLSDIFLGGEEIKDDVVMHHNLEKLVIKNSDKAMVALLSRVAFPGLKSLAFQNFSSLSLSIVSSFLEDSSCHLRELVMARTGLVPGRLIPFLRGIPSLERLELEPGAPLQISARYSPDKFFEALGLTATWDNRCPSDPLLPNLHFLRYTQWSGSIDWKFVSTIFGPVDCDPGEHSNRRPLRTVQIHVPEESLGGQYTYLDRNSVLLSLDILKSGLCLEIGDPKKGMDLIRKSLEHHGIEGAY